MQPITQCTCVSIYSTNYIYEDTWPARSASGIYINVFSRPIDLKGRNISMKNGDRPLHLHINWYS